MSFVGPRFPLLLNIFLITDEERLRHAVRPGLTGLAQINGRSFLSWEDRFELDNQYVKQHSFWLTLVLFKTFGQVLRRENVANTLDIKTDEKGAYLSIEGRVFRRLDLERRDMSVQGNRE